MYAAHLRPHTGVLLVLLLSYEKMLQGGTFQIQIHNSTATARFATSPRYAGNIMLPSLSANYDSARLHAKQNSVHHVELTIMLGC